MGEWCRATFFLSRGPKKPKWHWMKVFVPDSSPHLKPVWAMNLITRLQGSWITTHKKFCCTRERRRRRRRKCLANINQFSVNFIRVFYTICRTKYPDNSSRPIPIWNTRKAFILIRWWRRGTPIRTNFFAYNVAIKTVISSRGHKFSIWSTVVGPDRPRRST